ncbi:hypothetical protein MNBD_BACTEROID06-621 [hydrothermal vent metagenome]|uniref:DUF2007 domain-containing protein n=1 Tax=hydrothermal vent metagenome TaxID=652676 RepID=A0A3B0UK69_9ZZZZ
MLKLQMQDFIIIATFTLPSELAIAKSRLESEGIECLIKDELTIQSYNFLSNAVGGVKLFVHKSKSERARTILKEGGFLKDNDSNLTSVEKYLNNPQNLKKLKRVSLILFGLIAIIAVIMVTYGIINRPTTIQKIANYDWCLDHIVYNNEEYYPNTIEGEVQLRLLYQCNEKLNFSRDGTLSIPGFESRKIISKWMVENDGIKVYDSDTLDFVFNGTFEVQVNNRELILSSPSTTFYCFLN